MMSGNPLILVRDVSVKNPPFLVVKLPDSWWMLKVWEQLLVSRIEQRTGLARSAINRWIN